MGACCADKQTTWHTSPFWWGFLPQLENSSLSSDLGYGTEAFFSFQVSIQLEGWTASVLLFLALDCFPLNKGQRACREDPEWAEPWWKSCSVATFEYSKRISTKNKANPLSGKCAELKGAVLRDYKLVRGWWEWDMVDETSRTMYLHTEVSGLDGAAQWKEPLLVCGDSGGATVHLISKLLISESDVVLNNCLDHSTSNRTWVKLHVQNQGNCILLPDLAQILGMRYACHIFILCHFVTLSCLQSGAIG